MNKSNKIDTSLKSSKSCVTKHKSLKTPISIQISVGKLVNS